MGFWYKNTNAQELQRHHPGPPRPLVEMFVTLRDLEGGGGGGSFSASKLAQSFTAKAGVIVCDVVMHSWAY